MIRERRRIPKCRHYRPKGLAVVRLGGRDFCLGRYDSAESWEKCHRLVADWLQQQRRPSSSPVLPLTPARGEGPSVNAVILAYWKFALDYYRKNGVPTGEVDNIRAALRPLRKLFGCSPGSNFGPDALELIREEMIRTGLSRKVINARVNGRRLAGGCGRAVRRGHNPLYRTTSRPVDRLLRPRTAREALPAVKSPALSLGTHGPTSNSRKERNQ